MALNWLAPDGGRAPRALASAMLPHGPRCDCQQLVPQLNSGSTMNDGRVRFRRSIGLPFRRGRVVCRSSILVADAICRPRKRSGVGRACRAKRSLWLLCSCCSGFHRGIFRRCACLPLEGHPLVLHEIQPSLPAPWPMRRRKSWTSAILPSKRGPFSALGRRDQVNPRLL